MGDEQIHSQASLQLVIREKDYAADWRQAWIEMEQTETAELRTRLSIDHQSARDKHATLHVRATSSAFGAINAGIRFRILGCISQRGNKESIKRLSLQPFCINNFITHNALLLTFYLFVKHINVVIRNTSDGSTFVVFPSYLLLIIIMWFADSGAHPRGSCIYTSVKYVCVRAFIPL